MMKVMAAKVMVKAILPVKFAAPGKNGIRPKRLLINIKKKIVNKNGMKETYR